MSNKKRRHEPIERRERHSPELKSMVGDIGCLFTLEAIAVLLMGLFVLFLGLLAMISYLTTRGIDHIGYEGPLLIAEGLIVSALGVFMFKVVYAFERFEPWAYPWVEFLSRYSRGLGYWLAYKHLYDDELRRAFNQPEYEYPEHPEYGPKLDDKGRPKLPRGRD